MPDGAGDAGSTSHVGSRPTWPIAAAVLATVAALGSVGCGGQSEQEQVGQYILDVNAIQRGAEPEFAKANEAYAAFSQGKLKPAEAGRQVSAAERSIRATRAQIDALEEPAKAATLDRLILRSFDANAEMARETTRLARYLPAAERAVAPLNTISGRLRRRLAAASDPADQAQALRSYGAGVDGMLADLRVLRPPPILVPTHRAQVARLQSARALAARLSAALRAQDAKRVAALLVRFRKLNASRARERSLADESIRAYNRRYRAITTTVQDAQRERLRLERSFL